MLRSFGLIIGVYLGKFDAEDRILVIYNDGNYEITDQELMQRFDTEKILLIEKFRPDKIITAVYLDNEKLQYNIKRFKIETTTLKSKFFFIKEGKDNRLEMVTTDAEPLLIVKTGRGQLVRSAKFKVNNMVEVMGWKAVGAKLTDYSKSIEMEWEKKADENAQPELF
jgi:topoisomerase-4 subunit A